MPDSTTHRPLPKRLRAQPRPPASALAVLLLGLMVLAGPAAAQTLPEKAQPPRELWILTSPHFFDSELVKRFEQRHQVRIRQSVFTRDIDRTERLLETGGRGYDLILLSGSDLQPYIKRGWLARLNARQLPNLQHVAPHWRTTHPGAEAYAVPYFWGTLGILYRRDLLAEPILTWNQLLEPPPELQGRIGMLDTPEDLFSIALKSLGYSINTQSPEKLRQAGERLQRQRTRVGRYRYQGPLHDAPILQGELAATAAHNADVPQLQALEPALSYVIPLEGSKLWVNYLALAAQAKSPALAYRFLDFLHDPEVAARWAQTRRLATVNQSAELRLPRAFLDNPGIYPSPQILEASEFAQPAKPAVLRLRNELFLSLTE